MNGRLQAARRVALVVAGLTLLAELAQAAPGFVVRASPLRETAAFSGKVLARLTPGAQVELGERRGGWQQVTAAGRSGWLRSYQVRAGQVDRAVVTESSDENRGVLSDLAAISRSASGLFGNRSGSSSSQTTATIGIRGLSAEELEAAKPDANELDKLKTLGATRSQAKAFGKGAGLKARKIKTIKSKS